MEKQIDTKQAFQTIEHALNLATKQGVYNIKEVGQIIEALIALNSIVFTDTLEQDKK